MQIKWLGGLRCYKQNMKMLQAMVAQFACLPREFTPCPGQISMNKFYDLS